MDMDTNEKVKSRWTRSFFTALNRRNDDERFVCDICHKDLASPSSLTLHRNTHVIERRYKCEPCQVSFHSQGHLQKHMRSTAHETRVEMTQAFGIPSSDNPRPYGCPECDVAFRKHGHLAKHLRSKSHVTKLEANGLVPQGTYAAFEKSGPEIRERLITTNCEVSLQSLRAIAITLLGPHHPQLQQQQQQQSLGFIEQEQQQRQQQQQQQQSMQPHHYGHQMPIKQHLVQSHQAQMISSPPQLHGPPLSTTTTTTTTNNHHQQFQPPMSHHHAHLQQQPPPHHLNQPFTSPAGAMPLDTTITPPPLASGITSPGCPNNLYTQIDPTIQQPTFYLIDPSHQQQQQQHHHHHHHQQQQQQNLPVLHRENSGNSSGSLGGLAVGPVRHQVQSSHHWNQHHLQMDDCFGANSSPPQSTPPPSNSTGELHFNGTQNHNLHQQHNHLLQQQQYQHHQQPQGPPLITPTTTTYPLDISSQTQSPISYHQSPPPPPPLQTQTLGPGPTASLYELPANLHHYQPGMI